MPKLCAQVLVTKRPWLLPSLSCRFIQSLGSFTGPWEGARLLFPTAHMLGQRELKKTNHSSLASQWNRQTNMDSNKGTTWNMIIPIYTALYCFILSCLPICILIIKVGKVHLPFMGTFNMPGTQETRHSFQAGGLKQGRPVMARQGGRSKSSNRPKNQLETHSKT